MSRSITITYRGVKFRRYPDAKSPADRVYYKPGQADRLKGIQALHQEVWKDANGVDEIPAGHHVHHDDHDTENNDPSNLVLLVGTEHIRQHMLTPERQAMSRLAIIEAQKVAPEWHRSEAGRAWHREHAKTSIVARPELELTCQECGGTYESKGNGQDRFCSNNCKSNARRKSGVDNEDRQCAECSETFTVNRYSKSACCSRSCGMKRSRRLRAERSA